MDTYINADGFTVFTETFFRERGHCCGNSCLHCPYGKLTENTKNLSIKAVEMGNLPDFRIGLKAGKVSAFLRKMNVNTFHQAARFVCLMPYKRNRDAGNPLNVLSEQRGTCSGKHQVLAQLARENDCLDLQLVIGIYKMNAQNTPQVAEVLVRYQLDCIPEAHTYLKLENTELANAEIFDFTTLSANQNHRFLSDLLLEKTVLPEELMPLKIPFHKEFLAAWSFENGINMRYSLDELWGIREACIAMLETQIRFF